MQYPESWSVKAVTSRQSMHIQNTIRLIYALTTLLILYDLTKSFGSICPFTITIYRQTYLKKHLIFNKVGVHPQRTHIVKIRWSRTELSTARGESRAMDQSSGTFPFTYRNVTTPLNLIGEKNCTFGGKLSPHWMVVFRWIGPLVHGSHALLGLVK